MNNPLKIALLSTALLMAGNALAGSGNSKMEMMHHANPMPNLMMIVSRHGEALNLTEQQAAALADWRTSHKAPMAEKVKNVIAMEKGIMKASLEGKSRGHLMGLTNRMLSARRDIASSKIDCRENMKRILNDEQFQQVTSMYANMHK